MDTKPPPYKDPQHCRHEWGAPHYSPCGYAWAICLFPVGILCCLRMKVRTCNKCDQELELENGQDQPLDSASYRTGFAIGAVTQIINAS